MKCAVLLLVPMAALVGCRAKTPDTRSDLFTLMVKFGQAGNYDDAIRVGQDWLGKHPQNSDRDLVYEQVALSYLAKAGKDKVHRDEWIQQAVAYFDDDLSVHTKGEADIELYSVGRGLEMAGDLSSKGKCSYYGRSIGDFEDEVGFIQGDSYSAYGKTIPLAPIRQENEKALERVKTKFEKTGCK